MIYLDAAATTLQKPAAVPRASAWAMTHMSSPGRGGHAAAMLAARGWTNQEIGAHMGISPNTVKRHISVVLQKLDIDHRQDLKKYMLQ